MSTHVQFLSLATDLVVAERHFPDDTADAQAPELAQLLANANHEPIFAVTEYGDTFLARPETLNCSPFRARLAVHNAYTAPA